MYQLQKNSASPKALTATINTAQAIAESFYQDFIGAGSNFKQNKMGKINPINGFTVAPVSVIASPMLGIATAIK